MSGEGCVVVAGIFPTGTVCRCVKAAGPEVLRPEGGELMDTRTVDDAGFVGFVGLEVGSSYFVSAYVNGEPVDIRVKGRTVTDLNEFLSQAPVDEVVPAVGVSETKVPVGTSVADAENAPPIDRPDLESGVPLAVADATSLPTGGDATVLPREAFYVYTGLGPEPRPVDVAPDWVLSDRFVPATPGATEALPLWEWRGEGTPPVGSIWRMYEGPIEDAALSGSEQAHTASDAAASIDNTSGDKAASAAHIEGGDAATASSISGTATASTGDSGASSAVQDAGVLNAATLSEAELRQSITDKGATPVI
jgi:hypothetical protein